MKFNTLKLAISGGIVIAFCFGWTTIATLINVPGFAPFAKLLEEGYKFYGYSISWTGVVIGGVWGFVEGFIWVGATGLIYNKLLKK